MIGKVVARIIGQMILAALLMGRLLSIRKRSGMGVRKWRILRVKLG